MADMPFPPPQVPSLTGAGTPGPLQALGQTGPTAMDHIVRAIAALQQALEQDPRLTPIVGPALERLLARGDMTMPGLPAPGNQQLPTPGTAIPVLGAR